jgi:beta-lactamase regulating signal transducer with metallopeptidase domain
MIISAGELVSWLAGLLLHAVWLATVIALAAWALLRQIREPRMAHAVAASGLLLIALGLVGVGMVTWPTSTPTLTTIPAVTPTVASTWQPQTSVLLVEPQVPSTDWRFYLVLAWSCGVMVLSLRHAGGCWRVMRLRRTAVPISGEIAERFRLLSQGAGVNLPLLLSNTNLTVPIAIGWWQPAVMVPASLLTGLPKAQLEALLLHELAHLRRQDWLVAMGTSVLESLLFFHPAIWWLGRRLRQSRELCCDAQALQAGAEPEGLARALLALAERLAPGGPALAATGGVLADRVRRILGLPERREQTWRALAAIILLPLLLAIITACTTASPERHTQTEPLASNPLESSGPEPAFPLSHRIRANASNHTIHYEIHTLSAPLSFWAEHGLAGDQPKRLEAAAVKRILATKETDTRVSNKFSPQLIAYPLQRAHASFITQLSYTKDYHLVQSRLKPDLSILDTGSSFEVCAEPVDGGIVLRRACGVTANLLGMETLTFPWSGNGSQESYQLEIPVMLVTKGQLEPDTRLAIGETIAMPMAAYVQQRGIPTFGPAIEHGAIANRVPDPDFPAELRQVFLLTITLRDDPRPRLNEPEGPVAWLDRTQIELDLPDASLDEAVNSLAAQLPVTVEVVRDADYAATRVNLRMHGVTARVALAQLLSQCLVDATANDKQLKLVSYRIRDMPMSRQPGASSP